ncbi:MAG TPA: type II secretion system F family protein [Dehalococcoidia bacterium]|jgi:tight adherence protein B
MDPIVLIAALAVMGAIVTGLLALYQGTASPRNTMERRLGNILGDGGPSGLEAAAADYEALRPTKLGKTPILSSLLQGLSWTSKVAEDLEKSDIKLTVSEFVGLRIILAAVAATIGLVMLPKPPLTYIVAALVAGVAFMLPAFYLGFAKKKRLKKLEEQLVEALVLISNSLKAGFGLMQSFELASKQMEHPISTEIRRTLYDINVGSQTDAALQALAKRSGSRDFDIVITAMLIQQSTGGNLSEILDNVCHTMRERIRIKGEISTLTSQQMLTGYIIGGMPIAMVGGFSLISPGYMTPLFTTTMGHLLLIGAGTLEFFGVLLIKKILTIEV